jgi:hypothetical protein
MVKQAITVRHASNLSKVGNGLAGRFPNVSCTVNFTASMRARLRRKFLADFSSGTAADSVDWSRRESRQTDA